MSDLLDRLSDSSDPIEQEMAAALRAYQDAKAKNGRRRSLGYEPRDINRFGAVDVIKRRVTSEAIGFEGIDKELSYEAIVDRHPDRFDQSVVSLARARLNNADENAGAVPVYAMNFGEQNRFWDRAKKEDLILMYEDPLAWEQIQNGNESTVRERYAQDFRKRYDKDTTEAWITRWINYSRIMRNNLPAIFIHNENGVLWWAETDGEWLDMGVSQEASVMDDKVGTQTRFIAKKPIDGWSNRTKQGDLLKLSELHPIMESISHTQATMQPVADMRGEYVRALIDGDLLTPWENLEEWQQAKASGVRQNKNKSPSLSIDDLVNDPTEFSGTRSNQAEGFVYVIGLAAYPGIYKVGHANDVEARKRTLQIGVPEEPKIHYEVEFANSAWAEKEIHKLINHSKVRGEWYRQDLALIKYYIDRVKNRDG